MEKHKYKAIPRINNKKGHTCEGCVGYSSTEICLEIARYISDKKIKSCVGSMGVIYAKGESERRLNE